MSDGSRRGLPPSKAVEDQLVADWQWLANTPQGQRIIADIMVWCGVYNQIVETDPMKMATRVGENNFAKRILGFLAWSPRYLAQQAGDDTFIVDRMMRQQDTSR